LFVVQLEIHTLPRVLRINFTAEYAETSEKNELKILGILCVLGGLRLFFDGPRNITPHGCGETETCMPTGWLRLIGSASTEDSPGHPQRRNQNVHWIREKGWLVAFNQMAEPCERESSWNEKQRDDPVEPDNNDGRKTNRYCNQMQRAIHRMIMRTVIVRVETHSDLAFGAGL
jgi:hypothetical protein